MMDRAASRSLILGIAVLFGVGLIAGCQPAEEPPATEMPPLPEGELAVEEPWARPGPAGGTSAVYFRLANGMTQPDTLVEIRTPATDSVSIHETYQPEGDTATSAMRPVGTVPVPSQQRVELAPGGMHVMLVNLSRGLQSGGNLIVDLEFASGEVQRLSVPIRETPPTTP